MFMVMNTRETLCSRLGIIMGSVGSAVGLGNIWRFPYIAGENGGGAFLLIYLIAVVILGLPVLISEFMVGRHTRKNAVGAYRQMSSRRSPWQLIGFSGVLAAFFIFGFYSVVAGWTMHYVVESFTGTLTKFTEVTQYKEHFNAFVLNPWQPALYTLIFVLTTHIIVALGVEKGIERSAKIMMPLLFIVLIILCVRSITMEGGSAGLRFFFRPDFASVTTKTLIAAVGQAFFSISVGLGSMITYASYFRPTTNLTKTAVSVTILDTMVAILAGIIIFPAVFSVGLKPDQGPELVFITLPNILRTLNPTWLWSSVFFTLLALAALTSTISIHEVITAYVYEQWRIPRRWAAVITSASVAILGGLCSLSLGALKEWLSLGGMSLFDGLDYLTANIMLPLGGIFTSLFVGWRVNRAILIEELIEGDKANKRKMFMLKIFVFILRWFAPIGFVMVFLDGLGLLNFLVLYSHLIQSFTNL